MYRRIRDLREDHDLTQREMAKILHCSQQVYSNYELGQRDIPTDVLIKLARYYQVSTDYILGLTNTPGDNRCGAVLMLQSVKAEPEVHCYSSSAISRIRRSVLSQPRHGSVMDLPYTPSPGFWLPSSR